MMRKVLVLMVGAAVASACGGTEPDRPVEDIPSMESQAAAEPTAHVMLTATQGQKASGSLMLRQTSDGVEITGQITGLQADGEHGIHVHEFGDCSAPDASSAGEHFNPTAQPHGDPDDDAHHLGDMVNLDVDDQGQAEVDTSIDDVTLSGPADRSLRNRSIVVHAMPDDYKTQPSGGSGARIACGVIPTDVPSSNGVPPSGV